MGRAGFVLRVVALAAVYFVTARLGLTLAFAHGSVTPVWPPAGIAVAALLLGGSRLWIGVYVGALLANVTTGAPLGASVGIAIGNTLEAVCAAQLLGRVVGHELRLDRVAHVAALLAIGVLGATAIAATIGVASLCVAGAAAWGAYGRIWWVWWFGDATGVLVMAPLLLAWG